MTTLRSFPAWVVFVLILLTYTYIPAAEVPQFPPPPPPQNYPKFGKPLPSPSFDMLCNLPTARYPNPNQLCDQLSDLDNYCCHICGDLHFNMFSCAVIFRGQENASNVPYECLCGCSMTWNNSVATLEDQWYWITGTPLNGSDLDKNQTCSTNLLNVFVTNQVVSNFSHGDRGSAIPFDPPTAAPPA